MKAVAALIAVGSLIAAAVLVVLGGIQPGANLDGFARADFGCLTTIDFESNGEYWIYLVDGPNESETTGCAPTYSADSTEFSVSGPDGEVDLERDRRFRTELDGQTADALYRFEVTDAGSYELEAVGAQPGTSVAIGGDPNAGRLPLMVAGIAVGLVGAAIAAMLWRRATKRSEHDSPTKGHADGGEVETVPPVDDDDAAAMTTTTGSWAHPGPSNDDSSVEEGAPSQVSGDASSDDIWAPPSPDDRRA